jgi:hypothetical protein
MEVTTVALMYKDPPITKEDLKTAQQIVQPVNFPSYEAVISEKAKALAVKMAEKANQMKLENITTSK